MSEMTIKSPTIGVCPKHGQTDQAVNVTIPGHEALYCLVCLAEWYEANLLKLAPMPDVERIQ